MRITHWSIYCRGLLIGTLYEIKSPNSPYLTHEIYLIDKYLNSMEIQDIVSLSDPSGYINPQNTKIFISERVIPPTRANISSILLKLNLPHYDAWELFKLNYGRLLADYIYVDFDNLNNHNPIFPNWEKYFIRWHTK